MKKILLTLLVLVNVLGINAQTESLNLNFTTLSSADETLIKSDATNWYYYDSKKRYSYINALSNATLTANGTELAIAKGLLFTCSAVTSGEGNIRVGDSRMWVAGSVTIVIPNVAEGAVLTVNAKTSKSGTPRGINVSDNVTSTSGSFNTTSSEEVTNVGTVNATGDVTLTFSGAMYLYSISVKTASSEGSETGEDTNADVINSAVSMNLNKNQALLALSSGDIKYYNTEDVKSIDIDPTTNQMNVVPSSGSDDIYYGTVKTLSFTKKMDEGTSGDIENTGVVITEAKGWQESAYVKWSLLDDAESYNVYIKGGQYTSDTKLDDQLVRSYGTYGRADALGLKAATDYQITVVPVVNGSEVTSQASTAKNLEVVNYDRTGYAHFGRTAGVGAYNNDGTLKANAVVLYITNNNVNTITCDVKTSTKSGSEYETRTGLGLILQALEKGVETRPFAIRFVGEIKVGSTNSAQLIGASSCFMTKGKKFGDGQNITFEGVGDDATMNGIGFRFNRAGSIEVRNLGILNHADDCFEFTQSLRIWVHNVDMYYGNAGSDSDQAKGDGSVDLKKGTRYCTFSYNHFWDSGKASLCGLSGETTSDYATYHHNWFDHSDSRHPRVRVKSIHVYNNYYDGISKYGAGATMGSSLFVERNYFRNAKFPMMISLQGNDVYAGTSTYNPSDYGTFSKEAGGMIKAYNNIITGETTSYWPYGATTMLTKGKMVTASSLGVDTSVQFDCYEVTSPSETVPSSVASFNGGNTYNNFDTDSDLMYSYTPDEPENVPAAVQGYYGAGRLNKGDISWTFSDADDTSDGVDTDLKKILNNYVTKFVKIFGDADAASTETGTDDGTSGDTGDTGDTTDDGTDTTDDGDGETVAGTTISASVECNFQNSKPSNDAFSVSGKYSTGHGTATVNGTTYTTCLKLESTTSVTFTTTKEMTLTLVFGSEDTKYTIKVDDVKQTGSNGVLTMTLAAGSHTLTKADVGYLFYIALSE